MLTVLWLTVWYLGLGDRDSWQNAVVNVFAVECIGYNVNVNFCFVAKVVEF